MVGKALFLPSRPRRQLHPPALAFQDRLFAQRRNFFLAAVSLWPEARCTAQRTIRLIYIASNRSRHSTIRFAALPSHLGGIAPFFHCPAINRASAGGSLLGIGSNKFIRSNRDGLGPLGVETDHRRPHQHSTILHRSHIPGDSLEGE